MHIAIYICQSIYIYIFLWPAMLSMCIDVLSLRQNCDYDLEKSSRANSKFNLGCVNTKLYNV